MYMGTPPPQPRQQGPPKKTKMCIYFQQGLCTRKGDCTFAHSEAELEPTNEEKVNKVVLNCEINTIEQSRAIRTQMRLMLADGGIMKGKFPTEGWKCRCGTRNKYFYNICGGKGTPYGCKTAREDGAIANYNTGNYNPDSIKGRDKPVVCGCLVGSWVPFGVEGHHLQAYFQQFGKVENVRGPFLDEGGKFNRAYIRFPDMSTCSMIMADGEDHYLMGNEVVLVEPAKEDKQQTGGKDGKGGAKGQSQQQSFGATRTGEGDNARFSYGQGGLRSSPYNDSQL